MAPKDDDKNGTSLTIPSAIFVTIVSWIFVIAMGYSMLETKDHAEKTYIRRETFEQFTGRNREDLKDIKEMLIIISNKLDKKQDRKEKP